MAQDAMHVAVHPGRGAVNLHAITGGKQHDFFEASAELEPATLAGERRRRHGHLLAHGYRRGLVTDASNEKFQAPAPFPELGSAGILAGAPGLSRDSSGSDSAKLS